jgi:hypothetical protein
MNCPTCGFSSTDDAHFCQNCGYRFDNIQQSEPIRVVIPQPQKTEPDLPAPQMMPTIIIKEPVKRTSNGIITALTVLIILLFIVGAGLFAYIFLSSRQKREIVTANINTSANTVIANTNLNLAAKPSPTTYEDLKNKIAPPAKSTELIDEEFSVAPSSHRSIPFSITNPDGARLAGGFRITKGKPINFYVYPAEAYNQYPTNGLKPVHLEQTRNKILNQQLTAGDYYLVFENNDQQPATVATELLLVGTETK